jgi:hypothetical protein
MRSSDCQPWSSDQPRLRRKIDDARLPPTPHPGTRSAPRRLRASVSQNSVTWCAIPARRSRNGPTRVRGARRPARARLRKTKPPRVQDTTGAPIFKAHNRNRKPNRNRRIRQILRASQWKMRPMPDNLFSPDATAPRPLRPHQERAFEGLRRSAGTGRRRVMIQGPTGSEKAAFHGELEWIARERGYSPGWVAHKFREKFGVWPNDRRVRTAELRPPSLKTKQWILSRQIAWAKGRAYG